MSADTGAADDAAAEWPGYDKFNEVQEILDRNTLLLEQINSNHAARTADALQRNVLLIQELNANVGKVVALYKELAGAFVAPEQGEAANSEQQAAAAATH